MMRPATLSDLRAAAHVVGTAFTKPPGAPANPMARRRRAPVTWFGELLAIVAREAYISDDADMVVHIGRRGGWHSTRALIVHSVVEIVLVFGLLLLAAIVAGGCWSLGVSPPTSVMFGAAVLLLVFVATVAMLVVAMRSEYHSLNRPTLRQASYRKGLPRSYWVLTSLGTADDRRLTALPTLRSWQPNGMPRSATLVVVAADARLFRLYRALGFNPLPGSDWVLYRSGQPSPTAPGNDR
jgi:hypothetical protein